MNDITYKFTKLKNWIVNNGGYIGNITLSNTIYGRSYISTKNINADDVIVKIPNKLWIDEYNLNVRHMKKLDSCEKIILALILEIRKGSNSFYYPYINLLPSYEEFQCHPLYECDFNFDSYLITEWKLICPDFAQRIISLIKLYYQSYSNIQFYSFITHDEFKYVYLIYLTRNWNKFVPGADLFQHRCSNSLMGYDDDNIFKIQSGDNYSNGDTIYINYGNKNNIDLLFQYGFKTNTDYIPIKFDNTEYYLTLDINGDNEILIQKLNLIFNHSRRESIILLLNYINRWKHEYFLYSYDKCIQILKFKDHISDISKYLLEIAIHHFQIIDVNFILLSKLI